MKEMIKMTKNPLNEPQESSSSIVVEKSNTDKNILELGKKLVLELGVEHSRDTLARWMAHYIAGLIHDAEHASPENKRHADIECSKAILNLWEYRSKFPDGCRPYEEIEPLLQQLQKLDPAGDNSFYYRHIRPDKNDACENSEVKQWLDLVEGINYAAKLIISYSLSKAADLTSDKAKEWVALAEKINPNEVEVLTVRLTSDVSDFYNQKNIDEIQRQTIQGRVDRLAGVIGVCQTIKDDLERVLRDSLP